LTLEESYTIITAYDGQEALEKLETPDLIVLDLMLPKVDGYEVLENIRSKESTKDIPVIVLSAKHQVEDIRKAISLGANEYITKPFEPEFLLSRIKELFEICDNNLESEGKFFEFGNTLNYIQQK